MNPVKALALSFLGISLIALGIVAGKSFLKRKIVGVESATESTSPSKVEQRILRAMQLVEKSPNKSDGYNQLASAYMQKARETGNFSINANADEAIDRSLSIEPNNYDALKLKSKLQLTYHRFSEALNTARRAEAVRNDDHDVLGLITDALIELGDYPGAVKAAQKMVDLRPDNSSYARVSYLRSLHGDANGAIYAMTAALNAADPNDLEAVAWCRVQLGNELMNTGKLEAAERQFDQALHTFPNHHLALQAKARARIAVGDLPAAVNIYEEQQAKSESADVAQALGDVYQLLGRESAARAAYRRFEILERENASIERSWRHMLNYWLDHDQNIQEALTLANREYEMRKDIFTCDSLAWALFKNGLLKDAKSRIDEALRTGTKDARINYHAGLIYNALKMRNEAARYLMIGAALNSSFDPVQSERAKRMLSEI